MAGDASEGLEGSLQKSIVQSSASGGTVRSPESRTNPASEKPAILALLTLTFFGYDSSAALKGKGTKQEDLRDGHSDCQRAAVRKGKTLNVGH